MNSNSLSQSTRNRLPSELGVALGPYWVQMTEYFNSYISHFSFVVVLPRAFVNRYADRMETCELTTLNSPKLQTTLFRHQKPEYYSGEHPWSNDPQMRMSTTPSSKKYVITRILTDERAYKKQLYSMKLYIFTEAANSFAVTASSLAGKL